MSKARVFICHGDEDKNTVETIYEKLKEEGYTPWMAARDIFPGEKKESVIQEAIKKSDFFLLLLSNKSIKQKGHIIKEIKMGWDISKEQLQSDIFMIPVMLEKIENNKIQDEVQGIQWVNYYEPNGIELLQKAFQEGMKRKSRTSSNGQRRVFLVAPQQHDDIVSSFTIQWARQINDAIGDLKDIILISVLGSEAVKDRVIELLTKDQDNPGIFIYINHGERNRLLGSDGGTIIDSDNVDLLKNKFVFAIACKSCAGLGFTAYEKGAVGYFGFNNDFQIIPTAQTIFGRCFLDGLMAIVKENRSPFEARMHIGLRINEIINQFQKLPRRDKTYRQNLIIAALRHNLDSMILWGDPNWRITY